MVYVVYRFISMGYEWKYSNGPIQLWRFYVLKTIHLFQQLYLENEREMVQRRSRTSKIDRLSISSFYMGKERNIMQKLLFDILNRQIDENVKGRKKRFIQKSQYLYQRLLLKRSMYFQRTNNLSSMLLVSETVN